MNSLFPPSRPRNRSRQRRIHSRRQPSSLAFDVLEPKHLLAGITFDAATGVVTVTGSGNADSVQVLQQSSTEILVDFRGVDSQSFSITSVSEVLFLGNEGDDWFNNESSVDSRAFGHAGQDFFEGGSGQDRFYGGLDADRLFGNDGDDILHGDGANRILGNRGSGQLFRIRGDDVLSGGEGDDRLIGHGGNDRIFGGEGDDFIDGLGGADRLDGGAGNDTVYGGLGNDVIRGGFGADRLFGQQGADNVDGEAGDDIVHGGPGSDVLTGGPGDDDIYGTSEDEIYGDDEDDDESDDLAFARPIGLSNRLTVSFAPDGTSIFDQSNQLFSAFSNTLGAQDIQDTIMSAFYTWAQYGNLDVGLVADSGDDFGVSGKTYGDPRFGDVRIGAIALPSDVFAVALGQGDFVSGTWAGDILFNSNTQFTDVEQFLTVALHEVGHVLGLQHSDAIDSAMHRYSIRTDLSADDIAAFQSLYGIRMLDSYDDGVINNDSLEESTHVDFFDDQVEAGTYPSILFGDISDLEDVDYFRVDAPQDYTGQITFHVVSDGISLLAPQVTLLSQVGETISQFESTSINGDLISVSASALESDGRYFLQIEGMPARSTGSFAVITVLDDRNTIDTEMMLDVARDRQFAQFDQDDIGEFFVDPENHLANDDAHSDDNFGTATELDTEDGYEAFSRFEYTASLSDSQDVDTYRFKSMEFGVPTPLTMNISVRSIEIGGMIPKAILFDANGNEIQTDVVVNGRGEYVIQAEGIASDATYYVAVESDDLLPFNSGNYELTISFSEQPVVFQTWAEGTVDSGVKQYHSLHVAESQIMQFAFEADSLPGNPNAMVWATIYDENGTIVFQTATRSGERRSGNTVFFAPGSYTIEIENGIGSDFTGLNYHFIGIDVGDSQGPTFSDPSDSPFRRSRAGEYVYPDDVVTEATFVFVDDISSNQNQPPVDEPPDDVYIWYWGLGV